MNCKVYNNTVSGYDFKGGGCHYCDISNSIIENNSKLGTSGGGGGCSNSTCTNTLIRSNRSENSGGGCFASTCINTFIGHNISSGGGGGLSDSSVAINCEIASNTTSGGSSNVGGGGGSNNSNNTNCNIHHNSASASYNNSGGGGTSRGTNINCNIYCNLTTTVYWGGGTYNSANINCAIYNNYSNNIGGGCYGGSAVNCTIISNKAVAAGGTNNTTLKNTVVYGNKLTTMVKSNAVNTNSSVETYCAFEDEVRAGTGNISLSVNNEGDANSPCFQSLSTDVGVVDETLVSNANICNASFLIDKGNGADNATGYGATYDLAGLERKKDTIDIGAYENQKTV